MKDRPRGLEDVITYETLNSRLSSIENQLGSFDANKRRSFPQSDTTAAPVVGQQNILPLTDWTSLPTVQPTETASSHSSVSQDYLLSRLPQQIPNETPSLRFTDGAYHASPSVHSMQLALETYFSRCHNQPYSLFHEQNFRHEIAQCTVPEYLVLALLVATLRFSLDPEYQGDPSVATEKLASRAWKLILYQCFDNDEGPNYRVVQAIIILAIDEFTACKHRAAWLKINIAASVAQSLHMMVEPPEGLDNAIQEEYRRTLWSIYLLDKLATCGRGRPAVFQDHSMRLQLPCTEDAFRRSSPATTPTLEYFSEAVNPDLESISPLATVLVLVSTLSKIAHFALEPDSVAVQRNPWDHGSGYTVLLARLTSFAASFEDDIPIQQTIAKYRTADVALGTQSVGLGIFSHVMYHLCHCLLQHPFLLRQQFRHSSSKVPTNFLLHAIHTNWQHAQKLTYILAYAKESEQPAWGSFYGYCSLVAGTINALHSQAEHDALQDMSAAAAQANISFLQDHGKYYKNSARMALELVDFMSNAGTFRHLISTSFQEDRLQDSDVDLLYGLLDYGTMSTRTVLADGTMSSVGGNLPPEMNVFPAGLGNVYDFGFGDTGDTAEALGFW